METTQVPSKKFYKRWWFWLAVFFVIGIFGAANDKAKQQPVATQPKVEETAKAAATPVGPQEARTAGDEAYLRLPNVSDTKSVICVAPDKAVWDEYAHALSIKDYLGIVELGSKGLFCVGNGSKVKVLDTSLTLTKVRILEGVNEVDADKFGEAGWTAREWVVTQ